MVIPLWLTSCHSIVAQVVVQQDSALNVASNVCDINSITLLTGHADGFVSFLDKNTLIVVDYCDDLSKRHLQQLNACFPKSSFPDLKIITMENCWEGKLGCWHFWTPPYSSLRKNKTLLFLDYSANMYSRKTMLHTRLWNHLCELFQKDFYF